MKKLLVSAIFFTFAATFGYIQDHPLSSVLFMSAEASNNLMEATGAVVKILPDDNNGSRHQRFLIRLNSGQTILIAHNIDLAPRVSPLSPGDIISFKGEYEPNSKGGVVHWTHHDPNGRHPAGWIRRGGQTYQ